MKLIELHGITKHYHLGQTPMTAVKDITLSFDKGEFTANLDPATSIAIMEIMQKLNRSEGATFLFSTHDQRLLDRL